MALPLIPIAMALAQFAPKLIGMVAGDKAEKVASDVVNIAGAVTGESDPKVALEKIKTNGELQLKFNEAILDYELERERERSKQLETVNRTMREEGKSEKWPQYAWRPFNGFCYPTAVMLIYFILPLFDKAVPDVPQWIWLGWLSILGVAVWDRGKEKRVKAGEQPTGVIEGAIKAIRG